MVPWLVKLIEDKKKYKKDQISMLYMQIKMSFDHDYKISHIIWINKIK
jgi:hypothetical protein